MSHKELIERVSKLKDECNSTDVLIEVALFTPDESYVSARANNAGTKVIYTTTSGKEETFWAADHTLTQKRRDKSIAILIARERHP